MCRLTGLKKGAPDFNLAPNYVHWLHSSLYFLLSGWAGAVTQAAQTPRTDRVKGKSYIEQAGIEGDR